MAVKNISEMPFTKMVQDDLSNFFDTLQIKIGSFGKWKQTDVNNISSYTIGDCESYVRPQYSKDTPDIINGAIFICMKTIPSLYMQSAIPISAGGYVYMSRFIHPSVAFVQSLNACMGMLNIAVMSMTFASYFCRLFPNADLDARYVAAGCAIVFTIIATFGARFTGNVQNIMVGIQLSDVLRIVSIPGMLLGILFCYPAMVFMKRYPNAAKRSFLRVPTWLQIALCVFSMGISFYMGLTLLKSLNPSPAISMVVFYIAGYGYYFIRVAYMKKQGVDIIARGKAEPASWIEKNKPLTAEEAKPVKNK